jgi:hypothetical protein
MNNKENIEKLEILTHIISEDDCASVTKEEVLSKICEINKILDEKKINKKKK